MDPVNIYPVFITFYEDDDTQKDLVYYASLINYDEDEHLVVQFKFSNEAEGKKFWNEFLSLFRRIDNCWINTKAADLPDVSMSGAFHTYSYEVMEFRFA